MLAPSTPWVCSDDHAARPTLCILPQGPRLAEVLGFAGVAMGTSRTGCGGSVTSALPAAQASSANRLLVRLSNAGGKAGDYELNPRRADYCHSLTDEQTNAAPVRPRSAPRDRVRRISMWGVRPSLRASRSSGRSSRRSICRSRSQGPRSPIDRRRRL
jgi:hypothetical protein